MKITLGPRASDTKFYDDDGKDLEGHISARALSVHTSIVEETLYGKVEIQINQRSNNA